MELPPDLAGADNLSDQADCLVAHSGRSKASSYEESWWMDGLTFVYEAFDKRHIQFFCNFLL